MDKRTLLAVVLSIIVLLIYQNFFVKPPVKTEPAPQQQTTVAPLRFNPRPRPTGHPRRFRPERSGTWLWKHPSSGRC